MHLCCNILVLCMTIIYTPPLDQPRPSSTPYPLPDLPISELGYSDIDSTHNINVIRDIISLGQRSDGNTILHVSAHIVISGNGCRSSDATWERRSIKINLMDGTNSLSHAVYCGNAALSSIHTGTSSSDSGFAVDGCLGSTSATTATPTLKIYFAVSGDNAGIMRIDASAFLVGRFECPPICDDGIIIPDPGQIDPDISTNI